MHRWATRMVTGFVVGVSMVGIAATVFAQAADTPFQVNFATNVRNNDTQINISNSGANGSAICVNLYAFAVGGPMVGCCSCLVGSNNLERVSVRNDLLEGRQPLPNAVVLKAMASTGTGGTCNASTVGTGGNNLVTGMVVWKGNTPFTPATLSAVELNSIDTQCASLHPAAHPCPVCQP